MEENLHSDSESSCKRTRFISASSSPEPCNGEDAVRKVIEEKRKWVYTDFGLTHVAKRQNGLDFTVMTYNILSQQNLELNEYLYDHCDDSTLSWDFRAQNLLKEIQEHNSDIICVQEIEQSHFEETFQPHLQNSGYNGFFKKKTGEQNDGCAIFYNNNVFDLDTSTTVELKHPAVAVLDRDNIALIAALKPKVDVITDCRIIVATTHLLYNPRRGDVKLSQLRVLLAEIDRLAFKGYSQTYRPQYHPVILCGDMNSEPFSPLYNFITCGSIFYKNMKAGAVSGQYKGKNKGRILTTGDLTLAPLGINRESKFEAVEICRRQKFLWGDEGNLLEPWSNSVQASVKSTACSNNIETPEKEVQCDKNKPGSSEPSREKYETGVKSELEFFSHNFNFLSTHKHYKSDGVVEATIHNTDSCCTVDYIFYSVNSKFSFVIDGKPKHKSITEGTLKLLGNYALLGEKDLKEMGGLPNALLSSDHTCLISRFLLTSL